METKQSGSEPVKKSAAKKVFLILCIIGMGIFGYCRYIDGAVKEKEVEKAHADSVRAVFVADSVKATVVVKADTSKVTADTTQVK